MRYRDLDKKWKKQIGLLTFLNLLWLFLIIGFFLFLQSYRATNQEIRSMLVKPDQELIGQRLTIDRDKGQPVQVNVYPPSSPLSAPLPLVINIHGGGFVGGDADVLDSQSQRLADQWGAVVVAVNYTKADQKPISYGVEEIKDTVLYFSQHASDYHIDVQAVSLLGYSAGAYYAASAGKALTEIDFLLASVILAYPWMTGLDLKDFTTSYPPVLFILAGQDLISQNAKGLIEDLKSAGRVLEVVEYADAHHSFIESNNPEGSLGATTDMSQVINSRQEDLARQAEAYMGQWIKAHMEGE